MRDFVPLSQNRISDDYAQREETRRSDHAWLRMLRFFKQWQKRRRDRADLAAMSYQQLADIGFAATPDSGAEPRGSYREQAVLCARSDRLKEIIDRQPK